MQSVRRLSSGYSDIHGGSAISTRARRLATTWHPLICGGLNDGFFAVACSLKNRSSRHCGLERFRALDQIERLGRLREVRPAPPRIAELCLEVRCCVARRSIWKIQPDICAASESVVEQ